MRRQDAFGIERPASAERITSHITPPEGGDLYKPIRLPRPYVGAKTVIYDIQDRTVSYSGEEIGRPIPRPLGSRRFSSTNLTDLTPPSQIPVNAFNRLEVPLPRDRQLVQPLQAAAERSTPPTIPRTAIRDRTVIQPPAEAHHSAELPLRNTTPVLLTRPTAQQIAGQEDVAIDRAETQSLETVTESIRAIHKRALYRNTSLMYQRFAFSLTRFPALVLVLMALWTNWGRGEGLNSKSQTNTTRVANEQDSDISALCTGGFILVCQVLLLHQHYNHYNKAKIMSYLYHISMLLAFCGAAIALVFASISFGKLNSKKMNEINCKIARADISGLPHTDLCLTWSQRIDYLAVIVGASSLIIILATFTMVTGAIGQALMKKKLTDEYTRISAMNAYNNEAMQY